MTAKATSKDKLKAFAVEAGWTLDPRAKRNIAGRWAETKLGQDTNVYLKPAAHGGTWRIVFEWTYSGSAWQRREGDTIKAVLVQYLPEDQEYETTKIGYDGSDYQPFGKLERVNTDWKHSVLWDVLSPKPGSNYQTLPLRKTVELLLTDPDTAVWLAAKKRHEDQVRHNAKDAAAEELKVAKAGPLQGVALEDGGHDWNSQFKNLTRSLVSAAKELDAANGTTDVPKFIADAQVALESLINSLSAEGAQSLVNYWDQASHASTNARINNAVKVDLDS